MRHFLLLLFLTTSSASNVSPPFDIIDLSHPISSQSPNPPWNKRFNLTNILTLKISEGIVATANAYLISEHFTTHIDAPLHFCPTAKAVHELPAEKLSGPGVVLHLKAEADKNRDFEVTEQTLKDWEEKNGRIPDGAVILLDFGWDKHWPDINKIYQTDNMSSGSFHHPGLSPAASKWLVANRKVNAIGIDTPSIDFGQTKLYESHAALCRADIVVVEFVARLEDVPSTGSRVFIGALKIVNGTGTPSRVFAVLNSASKIGMSSLFITMLVCIVYLYDQRT